MLHTALKITFHAALGCEVIFSVVGYSVEYV